MWEWLHRLRIAYAWESEAYKLRGGAGPAQVRAGVEAFFTDHMKRTARQNGCASVLIGSHPPLVSFYERMGAVRCGTRPPQERVTWERPILKLQIVENAYALDT